MTPFSVNSTNITPVNSAAQFRGINIVESRRDYKIAQCPFCWVEFNFREEYFIPFNSADYKTTSILVECPACECQSHIFVWMDETGIPNEISLFVK